MALHRMCGRVQKKKAIANDGATARALQGASRFQPSYKRPSCATIHTSMYIHEVRHGNADDSGLQQR